MSPTKAVAAAVFWALAGSMQSKPEPKLPFDTDSQNAAVVQAELGCDIAEANAFSAEYNHPTLPVLIAFGGMRLHQWRRTGSFRLDQAVEENGDALIRSYRDQSSDNSGDRWCELLFQLGPKAFIHANNQRIVGYASHPVEAERLVREFSKKYEVRRCVAGSFQLINTACVRSSNTESVSFEPSTMLNDEMLNLHYGDGFAQWHRAFCQQLIDSKCGLSIFSGPAGTGKTSYLRHLAGALKESHRFYFLPPAHISTLSDSEFLEIWSGQRRAHPDRRFVVFLEDAEARF